MDITYQRNHKGILGRGPGNIPAHGCVLCSTYMGLIALNCIDPKVVSLEHFHAKCIGAGAFDSNREHPDWLDVDKAVTPWGAMTVPHIEDDGNLPSKLRAVFKNGGVALVRVGFKPKGSNHTIMCHSYAPKTDNFLTCDPAIGHGTLRGNLTQISLRWGEEVKDYYATNIRPIYRKATT